MFYVDRQSYAIVKTELFDKSGKLAKLFDTSGWRRIGNYWRPQLQTMSNVAEHRVTLLREVERKLDVPFEPYYVGQQYLRSE
ncbi:outer membrane lipoprotein-sorting protein [Massilia sp. B-10]|nr:outer membrane lipoprotein-sorting protein [Massilia sp. B-10]UUZ54267.1 outer membrane lipoprotein-sorting protein [Massilia sp. H-1]